MENYLGGSSVAGGKMKAVSGLWNNPNTGATNESGFSGLPGGGRNGYGSFYPVGGFGYWWSSTEYSSTFAWYRFLYANDGYSARTNNGKTLGFSVRCLRD